MNSYKENKTFLSRPYGSKDEFLNQYSTLFSEKETAKQLYIQVLREVKVAIFEGNLKNFTNLGNIFSYIINYENFEELPSYSHDDDYPFKGTNIIVLTCKYNKLEILKHIFSNYSTIYEHLFKNEKKLLSPEDVDENLHNAFYYSIRANNVELVETLIQKWPGDYFNTHLDKLDIILSKAYVELKLKNVLLSEAIEVFIEEKLINLRFFSSKTAAVQNNTFSLPNISERIELLIEQINSLKSDSEVNEEFLFMLKNIIQNINTLKRLIKITYSKLPWEEIEFCLVCFVLSFTQQKEINLFYRAVLNKARILKHLANFSSGLEKIKDEVGAYRTSTLSNLPKISRRLNMSQIIKRNPEFEALFSDYQKIRDIHSLNTISTYITLALSADVKSKEGQLTVTRCLQVIGECMKNTLQSPKLSSYMCDLLLQSLPRKTREVVIDLRNSLSHVNSLSQRIDIQENTKLSFLQGVQDDIKRIGQVITDILFESKLKTLKDVMQTIINTNDLKEAEEMIAIFNIEKLDNIMSENLHLSECNKFSDIVNNLKSTIPDKTVEEEEIFVQMDEIINTQSNKLANKVEKYSYGISELNFFNQIFYRRIDEQVLRSIKFTCNNFLANIAEKSGEPRTLKCLAELAVRLLSINEVKKECGESESIKSSATERFERIKALVFEIMCIAEIQMENVQWVNDLREKLSDNKYADKCQPKNYITKDEYVEQLTFKLLDLRSILKNHKLDDPSSIQSVKSNGKLIAALEMLILDILSLLGQIDKRLEDSFFYLDQSIPYLIGKNLRNHLAHYNTVIDILPSDPATVLILNAQIIAEKLEANPAKIGKYVEEELAKLKNKVSVELKLITLKQKMFDALEAGDFEFLKSCIAQGADIHSRKRDNWTTLHAAAKGGNVSIVKFLVEQKVNVDLKSANQQNPLHVAAASGSANVVEYFIKQQYYDLDDVDDTRKTPLHLATLNNQISTIEILLKHKVNYSAKDKSGESPLHYAVQQNHLDAVKLLLKNEKSVDANEKLGGFTPLHLAANVGSLDVVQFLVSRGASVNATTYAKELPLHLAALNGHTEVVKILVENKSEINARSLSDCTPLLYATENGHKEISEVLLKHGAVPNIFDKSYKYGPIHFAAMGGHVEILKALLSHNANTNVTTVDGNSPLSYAVGFGQLESVKILLEHRVSLKGREMFLLHIAVKRGYLDIVEYLINQKFDVNATDDCGFTPLHYAASVGRDDIATLLIKRNAKVNARNAKNGFTSLLVALVQCIEGFDQLPDQTKSALEHIYLFQINNVNECNPPIQRRYEKVVEVLLKNGADANAKTATETSALHFAAASGKYSIVKMLLEKNVSVNQQCKLGFTPMHSAVMFGHKQIVELLLANKAKVHLKTFYKATALHFAVEYGRKNIVKLLLANNANINEKNASGLSPAAITFKENRAEILDVLIQNGADVHDNKEKILSLSIAKGSTDVFKLLLKHVSVKNYPELSGELLHLAVTRNNVEVVNALIAHGIDLNAKKNGYFALFHAVCRKQEQIVELLLKNGADVNGVKIPEGTTALHLAAMANSVEIVEILLNNGINVNARNINNNTALHLAIKSGFFRIVKFLFSWINADINETGCNHETLLHMAAEGGNVEIIKFLLERGANLNIVNGKFIKAIHVAIMHGRLEVVEYFLDQGMDVRRELDINYRTLLHYAATYNRLDIAKFLIRRGADINAEDVEGNTPLLQAARFTTTAEFITLLLENGAMYNLGNKLGEMPIDKCKDDRTRWTLYLLGHLFQAVEENENLVQVTAYLKVGAIANARNAENLTPLHLAAREGNDDMARVLLEYKSDPNALGQQGFTPLHYAAKYGHLNVCLTLVRKGAIYDATDENGKTPLDLSENKSVTDFLKQIHSYFEKVADKNIKVIQDLNRLKDKDMVKTIMRARNRDGKTLIATAVLHDFPKVNELKEISQLHLNAVLKEAEALCAHEKFDLALTIYAMVLEVRTEILGKNNLGTLDVRSDIATVLYKQQKYDEAFGIYSELYEQYRSLLGENSKESLSIQGRLALILHRLARNDEAIVVYEDIYEKQQKILAMDHPDLLETLTNKAMVLLALGRNKEAMKIYTSAYRRQKNLLGAYHPKILVLRTGIAFALKNFGNYEEALKIFRKIYEVRKKVVGLYHSDTLRTHHYIVLVLEAQNNFAEALKECKDLLKIQEKHLGPDHLDTLNTQQSMAQLYSKQGLLIDALKVYNNYLPALRRKLGPNHPNVRVGELRAETLKNGFQLSGNPEILNEINNLTKEAITAAKNGDLETLKSLIRSEIGINDTDDEGQTPLYFACEKGHYDVALLLLDSGANVTVTSNMGNTPLHVAALNGYEEIAKLLLGRVEREALLQYVNAKTKGGGNTALHAAAKAGHYGIVRILLVNGASFDVVNKKGKTPLKLAQSYRITELLETIVLMFENARTGNEEVVRKMQSAERELLNVFANVRDRQDKTLVQVAALRKHKQIATAMIAAITRVK